MRGKADIFNTPMSGVLESASRFARGERHAAEELWYIFAPTCDWDDAGGS